MKARDGIEAQHGLNDTFPGDEYPAPKKHVAPGEILELFKGGYLSIAETIEALYGEAVVPMPDAERQLLVVLATRALVEIRDDADMKAEAQELMNILRKINGVDKTIVVHG